MEYLAAERLTTFKTELVDGRLFAMAGASPFHNRVKGNIDGMFFNAFASTPCQSFTSDQRVFAPVTQSYFYPDIVVACEPLEFDDETGEVLLNPTILIEILSPSTERFDAIKKFRHYQSIASLQEYVLVDPKEPIIVHHRRNAGDEWSTRIVAGLDDSLVLPSVKVTFSLRSIYDRISFAGPEPELS